MSIIPPFNPAAIKAVIQQTSITPLNLDFLKKICDAYNGQIVKRYSKLYTIISSNHDTSQSLLSIKTEENYITIYGTTLVDYEAKGNPDTGIIEIKLTVSPVKYLLTFIPLEWEIEEVV